MIRLAKKIDLEEIKKIYQLAKGIMIASGNHHQWLGGYPSEELLLDDINKKQLYVLDNDGCIDAVFALIFGKDETYQYIEGGKWLTDSPYGTIHRIASSGRIHGVLKEAVDYSLNKIPHLRIDTHEQNVIMKHLLDQLGFTYCGIIYLKDGNPRLAYELVGGNKA